MSAAFTLRSFDANAGEQGSARARRVRRREQDPDVTINAGYTASGIVVKGGDDQNVYATARPGRHHASRPGTLRRTTAAMERRRSATGSCAGRQATDTSPSRAAIRSEVHLAAPTRITSANPATAPANVHDPSADGLGSDEWSGTVTVRLLQSLECSPVTPQRQLPSPRESAHRCRRTDLLPQAGLAAGDYSYQESFTRQPGPERDRRPASRSIVDRQADHPTTPSTSRRPVPRSAECSLTGCHAGVALVVSGAALIVLRRRRDISRNPLA